MSSFDIGTQQLHQTHEEMATLLDMGVGEQVTAKATEMLNELALQQFYSLCEIVQRSPDMVDFYAGALQRVQILAAVYPEKDVLEEETAELESFFELFAPEHDSFQAYIARQFAPVVSTEVEKVEVEIETEVAEQAEAVPDDTTEAVNWAPEGAKGSVFDGVSYGLSIGLKEHEAAMLDRIIVDAPRNEFFSRGNVNMETIETKGTTFAQLANDLMERGILESNGKAKGGRKYQFTKDFSAILEKTEVVEEEIIEAAAEVVVETDTPTINKARQHRVRLDIPEPKTPPAPKQETEPQVVKGMTKQNRLQHNGIRLDDKFTPYEEFEEEILRVLSNSPRKAPMATGHIAETLTAAGVKIRPGQVQEVLTNLQDKLPESWIIKEKDMDRGSVSWRLGSGIRIKDQSTRGKK